MGVISLAGGDSLVAALRTGGKDDILLLTQQGQALRFSERDARFMGRQAGGIRGIRLRKDDRVIGAVAIPTNQEGARILLVGLHGFGKLVEASAFKRQKRGGTGLRAMPTSGKTGSVVGVAVAVQETEEAFAVSRRGLVLRIALRQIKSLSRGAQGVRLMRLDSGDAILAVRVL